MLRFWFNWEIWVPRKKIMLNDIWNKIDFRNSCGCVNNWYFEDDIIEVLGFIPT